MPPFLFDHVVPCANCCQYRRGFLPLLINIDVIDIVIILSLGRINSTHSFLLPWQHLVNPPKLVAVISSLSAADIERELPIKSWISMFLECRHYTGSRIDLWIDKSVNRTF
jgi:hypothetical protein